jgi:hypothetical protein
MNKKVILISAIVFMIIFGLSNIFSLFGSSLKPNQKAIAELPRIEVSEIKSGEYKFVKNPIFGTLFVSEAPTTPFRTHAA